MPLALPDDDDGPDTFKQPPVREPRKRRPRQQPDASKKTKAAKAKASSQRSKSTRSTSAPSQLPAVELPPDDTGNVDDLFSGIDIGFDFGGATVEQPPAEHDLLTFDHPKLKESAQSIPSQVNHPYRELDPILRQPRPPCDAECIDTVWEIYSIPRLQPIMNQIGGKCRRSFDLKTLWNLQDPMYQKALLQDLATLQPCGVMLSPPCTYVCRLMASNWSRMETKKKILNLLEAVGHVDFSMWVAQLQDDLGRYFAFEHPDGSLAWERDSVA